MKSQKVILFLDKISKSIIRPIRKMSSQDSDVIIKVVKDKGILLLNRPEVLNALNLSMVKKIYSVLKGWEDNKLLVIVQGAGEKSFCAGGDVRAIAEAGCKGNKQLGVEFFRTKYRLNGLIGSYKIPYIAFIDGIVMGGGVGLSVHGPYRIATERTIFAMPETQIGLFPDVGGSHFLPRLTGRVGWYLALTGRRLKGSDVVRVGVATHYCESKHLHELETELLQCSKTQDLERIIEKFDNKDIPEFTLQPILDKINYCFAPQTMEEIISRLEKDDSEWAKDTIQLLNQMSPTSLKITLKELELGKSLSLQECLQMEYKLATNCLENKDFYEGVRALLIDKDKNPKWNPSSLSEVSEDLVNSHFRDREKHGTI